MLPPGRRQSASGRWDVVAVCACALAGSGLLMVHSDGGGGGDGRRASTASYNLPTSTRAAHRALEFN